MNLPAQESRQALDAERLRAELTAPRGPLGRFEWAAQTGSTNTDLAEAASRDPDAWPDLSLLTVEAQQSGKGRLERPWKTPVGGALAISLVLRPSGVPVDSLAWLSMLSAVAVCRTLRPAGVDAWIKWPNDVLAVDAAGQAKKICGILAQLVLLPGRDPAVVLGTGINVSQDRAELPTETSTSLLVEGSRILDRNILVQEYVRNFTAGYQRFVAAGGNPQRQSEGFPALAQEVASMMLTLGQQVRAELPDGSYRYGRASGIDAQGALLITDPEGTSVAVSAADVVHLRRADAQGIGYA